MANKKITLADVIERKKQGKMNKLQVKFYDSKILGGRIEVRKIPLGHYMELIENIEKYNSVDAMNVLIYECCPLFRENTKEAMEVYKVAEATDLPSAILEDNIKEMNDIIEIINSFYGLDEIDIKN